MKLLYFLLIPLIVCIEKVNDYTFDKIVKKSGDYVFVDFYADWCRHCQQLMPTIEKLSEEYLNVPGIQVVKHNGGERSGRKMVKKYEIDGFPMMVLFHGDDEPIVYEGSRDFTSINNFLKLATGVNEVKNPEIIPVFNKINKKIISVNDYNLESVVLNANKKTLMMVGGEWCRHCAQLKPKVDQINQIFLNDDDFQTVLVMLDPDNGTTNKLRKVFGIEQIPSLLFFDPTNVGSDGLKRPELYEGKRNVKDILKWVNNHGFNRLENGRLDETVGTLDVDLQSLKQIDGGIKLLQTIDKFEVDEKIKTYYGKVIEKFIYDKPFIIKEMDRLQAMINNNFDDLNAKAIDWIDIRLNILRCFKDI